MLQIKDIEKDKLYNFLRDMEFNRLLSQAISLYGEPNKKIENSEINNKKINVNKYETILTEKQFENWVNILSKQSIISVDTETSSLNPIEADLVGISFCYEEGKACYIPIKNKKEKCLKINFVIKKIKPILEDQSIKKIGQNIKFDNIILKKNDINVNPIEDTMLASYTLDAGLNRHNLDTLSEIHLGHKTISFKDLVGTGKKKISFEEVDLKTSTKYAGEDADVTFRLYNLLKKRLDREKLTKIYEILEKPMVKVLSDIEINGVKVNKNYLKKLSKNFQNKITKIEKEIYFLAKKKLNR